jgi:hypothetical protein
MTVMGIFVREIAHELAARESLCDNNVRFVTEKSTAIF